MSGTSVQVTVNDEPVRSALARMGQMDARERRPIMMALASYLQTSTMLRYRNQVGPDGKRWQPSQRALKEGGQTLRLTSRLFHSLTSRFTSRIVDVGTNVEYARAHQFGFQGQVRVGAHRRTAKGRTKTGRVWAKTFSVRAHSRMINLPARPFLGINAYDEERIAKIILDRIRELGRQK